MPATTIPGRPNLIDPRAPRFNQAVISVALLGAFLIDFRPIAVVLALALGAGVVFGPAYGPFLRFFAKAIRPRLSAPDELEDPRPPRFAALVGTLFLAGAGLAFAAGATTLGWALALIVAALAGLAAITRVCVGCEMYIVASRILRRRSGRAGLVGQA